MFTEINYLISITISINTKYFIRFYFKIFKSKHINVTRLQKSLIFFLEYSLNNKNFAIYL